MSSSPRKKIKVFLDTNIIIQGRKLSGSEILKKLSKDGKIKLFISPDVLMEQYRLSWKLDRQRDEFLSVHKDYVRGRIKYILRGRQLLRAGSWKNGGVPLYS